MYFIWNNKNFISNSNHGCLYNQYIFHTVKAFLRVSTVKFVLQKEKEIKFPNPRVNLYLLLVSYIWVSLEINIKVAVEYIFLCCPYYTVLLYVNIPWFLQAFLLQIFVR